MKYLLDTDHCSYIQRGHPSVISHLLALSEDDEVLISVISQGELLAGIYQARSARRRQELRRLYDEFLLSIADVLTITSAVAEQYAKILAQLVQKGTPIPINDIWIAAAALAYNMVLVSADAHFRLIEGLQVEDWTQP
ncbi:MAG: PIN domain-containing protein [Armatimonadota bacterium]